MDIDHHPNLQLSNSELSEEKYQTLIANLSGIVYRCGSSGFEGISKTNEKGRLII
jgi:hypothetical protein